MCKKYFFEVGYMDTQVFRCKVLNTLHVQEVFFQSWIYGPQVFRCKVLNTLHVQEVFFSKLDVWTPRYLGAKYWILCTCKKYFFKVGYMDPQVFRCKVLNTLHVQEVFFLSWINGPPGVQVQSIEYFACATSIIFWKFDRLTPRYFGVKY